MQIANFGKEKIWAGMSADSTSMYNETLLCSIEIMFNRDITDYTPISYRDVHKDRLIFAIDYSGKGTVALKQ